MRRNRIILLSALLCLCCVAISACSSGISESVQNTPVPNVTVVTNLKETFDCDARDCLAKYRSFVTDHPQFAHPRPAEVVLAELDALDQEPLPPVMQLSQDELRTKIIDALNIGFMLDGLDARPLKVTIFVEEARGQNGVISKRLIFNDPLVGEFEVLQLEPAGNKRVPAIIGLHGHYDSPEDFASNYLGDTLAAEGYLVIMPQFRAMGLELDAEEEIGSTLLFGGFHLMAMRVYETLLIEKYLRSLDRVNTAQIGIISHSGGSSAANLVIHLTKGIAAQVTDYYVEWRDRNFTTSGVSQIHCETVPSLFPLTTTFPEDWSTPIPRLSISHPGYEGHWDEEVETEIRNFFATHLQR
jgi:dienelactone hydrolase